MPAARATKGKTCGQRRRLSENEPGGSWPHASGEAGKVHRAVDATDSEKAREVRLGLGVDPGREFIRSWFTALCAASAMLPLHHRNPCDRLIIAAAQRLDVPVVTVDPRFAAYGVTVLS
ncbi:MAG TPA: PIN domain-containing protein [Opitutaceae bacterium]